MSYLNCLEELRKNLGNSNLASIYVSCTANALGNANHFVKGGLVGNFAFKNYSTTGLGNPKTFFFS